MITPAQCKMARAALGWSLKELAQHTSLGVNTISRFENGAEALMSTPRKIQSALEAAGVVFIDEDGGGPGVRLRDRVEG